MSTPDQTQPLSETSQKTRMIGCGTDSVCCVHDGTITRSINSRGSFIFSNNTFTRTDRSNTPTTYTGEQTARLKPIAAEVLFDRCTFKNCYTLTGDGGAICSYQVGQIITVALPSFLSCHTVEQDYAGGAIFLSKTKTTISDTKFESCYGLYGGACAFHPYG
ncbi:hypothetical protein BLNAU_11160 [Blattamonas nauphoetae]|uniref:Uncharacterized protein n=1 Tax=Blattamonas nauphoetae TaxID=2049346 RepID=A0ABQ9XQT9_9EUKA|nr:hypothetical protein BLNAU_11160 [Blattamonas nauphoetae]